MAAPSSGTKSLQTPSAFQRDEGIVDIPMPTINTSLTLPTQGGQIPNDRFLYGLRLQFEGRITNGAGAAAPTGVQADAPFSLIENITVEGFHRPRNQKEQIYNIRGADLRELIRIYTAHDPLVTPAPGFNLAPSTALNLAASGVNDIRFTLELPFTLMNLPIKQQIGWLLDAPNYDSLQLKIQFADDRSVFTGGTAGAFTAFGSTTGSPRLRVMGLFSMGGEQKWSGFVPGRVWRYATENTSGDIVTTGTTGSRQFNVPRGFRVRSILIKTGVKSTAASAGNNVYNTLSDTVLTNIKLNRGINRVIRFYPDSFLMKESTAMNYGFARPNPGYMLMDFAMHGAISELFDTTGLVAGPSGDTDVFLQADVPTGVANQAALYLIEEARYLPIMAS